MAKRRRLTTAGVLLVGTALLTTLLGPASGQAARKQGACVAVYPGFGYENCSFKGKGSAKMTYRIIQNNYLDSPYWEVGLCVVATWSCVRKYDTFYPLSGTVRNPACLTNVCIGYVRLGSIGTGYAYTIR